MAHPVYVWRKHRFSDHPQSGTERKRKQETVERWMMKKDEADESGESEGQWLNGLRNKEADTLRNQYRSITLAASNLDVKRCCSLSRSICNAQHTVIY